MFKFFKKRRIEKYTKSAFEYICQKYVEPPRPIVKRDITKTSDSNIRYSISGTRLTDLEAQVLYTRRRTIENETESNVLYSERPDVEIPAEQEKPSAEIRYSLKKSVSGTRVTEQDIQDRYNASKVTNVLRNCSTSANVQETLKSLEQNINQTFVDKLLQHIREKGLRDSVVYKSAQVDKRLFSKIISNHEYKPSKDTAIALSLALKLSLDETNDMLSRAGYTFSHSNMRDIVIEFFFREEIYNLFDLNDVLYNLKLKLIGRF